MAIPHHPIPEGYGNQDTRPRWQVGDFKVGDVVEFYIELDGIMQPSAPEVGIISFVSGGAMSVCVGCSSIGRPVNVCVSQLYNIRHLAPHEYTKLATSLKQGCQTDSATTGIETGKEKTLAVSHTIAKRIEDYTPEEKTF
tara:strand:- start:354 stop:773 length:420 start_codon:yes stop_codon:yes gene_type:complete